jgi:catechol 2,3-dioxygenase-like lactoylglutathione lyase family enzyme
MTIRRLDHIVLATSDIAQAAQAWLAAFDVQAEPPYRPDGSHMELAKLPLAAGAFLELARPTTDDHRIARFIADRGEGMFSISLHVDDIDKTVADLRSRGVDVSDPEPGAWPNTRLARIPRAAANGVAVQLIERS